MHLFAPQQTNVTSDAASLCLKSGNSVILRGGSESFNTNKIIVEIIKDSLSQNKINPDGVNLVPYTDRDVMKYILRKDELIDLMRQNNFAKCSYRNLSGGIVSIHSGWKI